MSNLIKHIRNEAHLTQEQLAENTGLSRILIAKMENDTLKISHKTFYILNSYFPEIIKKYTKQISKKAAIEVSEGGNDEHVNDKKNTKKGVKSTVKNTQFMHKNDNLSVSERATYEKRLDELLRQNGVLVDNNAKLINNAVTITEMLNNPSNLGAGLTTDLGATAIRKQIVELLSLLKHRDDPTVSVEAAEKEYNNILSGIVDRDEAVYRNAVSGKLHTH